MSSYNRICVLALLLTTGIQIQAQNPNWSVNYSDFQNEMTVVLTISDECVPSADVNDIVAAFDFSGQIRGVEATVVNNRALLRIGSNGAGELLYFKVYDASSDAVYYIHTFSIPFVGDELVGSFLEPLVFNFDSDPQSTSGGPHQWVVGTTATNMAASESGMWSLISGAGGELIDPSDPTTGFTGTIGTTYLLAWTLDEAEGCIGETDEVSVTFAVSQSEDTPERCADGIDNDGDGLTDCQEGTCGKPTLTNISKSDPTALTCSTEASDGMVVITQTGASLFSIDNGMSSQSSATFTGLPVGEYNVWMQNDFAGCIVTGEVSLINTLSVAPPVTGFAIDGPATVCGGSDEVTYSIDQPLNGSVAWTYTGTDATILASGTTGIIDFGSGATEGILTAVMSNACSSSMASMEIGMANSFLCSVYSNCIPVVNVFPTLLENPRISHVFQASDQLNSNAALTTHDYEFTAGNTLEFTSGFSIDQGLSFIADIKNCTN